MWRAEGSAALSDTVPEAGAVFIGHTNIDLN